jgi:ApaG protein
VVRYGEDHGDQQEQIMEAKPFYYKETQGIRITVRPTYRFEHSEPELRRFVFEYFIRIENVSRRTAQLLTRHWRIHDSIGEDYEVVGDGVVGQQPILAPGEVHEYQSYCVLKSPRGHMEGSYRFIGKDDIVFDAMIPRFLLVADEPASLL